MALAEAKAVANAVAKALNDNKATIDPGGTWEANAVDQIPQHKVEDLGNGKVTVVPIQRRSIREARDFWRYEYDIDVGCQQRLNRENINHGDEQLLLAEKIDEWFADAANDSLTLVDTYSGATQAEFFGSQLAFLATENLEQLNVAHSVVRLTFQVWRE